MQFFILVLLICLFVFLYCVYLLANDDFIFLRRDVTMEKLFNIIFIGSLFCLFFSRLFYGFSEKGILASPFVFLLIPYFPGLSLLGAVIGAGVYFLYLSKRLVNSLPFGRMFDFFSIAFLISLPIGFIGYFLFSQEPMGFVKLGIQTVTYLILFIIFLKFFLPRLLSGKFKEGTISLIFLIFFSLVSLIANIFVKTSVLEYLKNFENISLIIIFVGSVVALFWHENLLLKIKQLRKGK